jgi:hypothetical protein
MLKEKLIRLCSLFPNDYKLVSYAGRGGFRSYLGICVSDLGKIFHLGAEMGVYAFDVDQICVDNTGKSYIVYFPEIEFNSEELD